MLSRRDRPPAATGRERSCRDGVYRHTRAGATNRRTSMPTHTSAPDPKHLACNDLRRAGAPGPSPSAQPGLPETGSFATVRPGIGRGFADQRRFWYTSLFPSPGGLAWGLHGALSYGYGTRSAGVFGINRSGVAAASELARAARWIFSVREQVHGTNSAQAHGSPQ